MKLNWLAATCAAVVLAACGAGHDTNNPGTGGDGSSAGSGNGGSSSGATGSGSSGTGNTGSGSGSGNGAGSGSGGATGSGGSTGAGSGSASSNYSIGVTTTPTFAHALPTIVGTAIGSPTSKVIGTAGGELSTADGGLTIVVPTGAFDVDTTVTIQEITNEAHGANGRAYRITPEGLHTSVPMTVRFAYTDNDIVGTNVRFMSIAYQDAQQLWHAYKDPAVDTTNKTLSVQTTHFSDWSRVAGLQIRPATGALRADETLQLQVNVCELVDDGDLLVSLLYECKPFDPVAHTLTWAVNGVVNGSAADGTLTPVVGSALDDAMTYRAPAQVSSSRTVAVSAAVRMDTASQDTATLVANIALLPDIPKSCEWLRDVPELAFEISFEPFAYTASAGVESYTGHQYGKISGKLKNQISGHNGTPYGSWTNEPDTVQGFVSIDDRFQEGDGKTLHTWQGSGLPQPNGDGQGRELSGMSLFVDFTNCTYTFNAGFSTVVTETTTYDGQVTTTTIVRSAGGLGFASMPINAYMADSQVIDYDIVANAAPSITSSTPGYVPNGQNDSLQATGATLASWTLRVAP